MRREMRLLSLTLLGAVLAACGETPQIGPTLSFDAFVAHLYREPGTGIYIADGDIPLTDLGEVRDYYQQYVRERGPIRSRSSPLIVNRIAFGLVDDIWGDPQRYNLSYCVSTAFGTDHARVVAAMSDAVAAWQQVASVRFVYRPDQNSACSEDNDQVVFDVRPTSGQRYQARAFFPHEARGSRNLLINDSALGWIAPRTLAGILRHELGHTLGFRHEHIRPEQPADSVGGTGCRDGGDNSYRVVTPYDSASVMHYPQCNGANTGDLVLTQRDRDGAVALYGRATEACNDAYCSEIYRDTPVAYWRFNERSGGIAFSDTGRSLGDYGGSVSLGVGGLIDSSTNKAAEFGRTIHDLMQVPSLPFANAFTVEAIIRPTALLALRGAIFCPETYQQSGFRLGVGSDGRLFFWTNESLPGSACPVGATCERATPVGAIVPGNTYHIAATVSGSYVILYVNGVPQAQGSIHLLLPEGRLVTGAYCQGVFTGVIDDPAVYFTALSPQRIQAHADARRKLRLDVSRGAGGETVVSSPAGISCGAQCTGYYAPGTTVTLTSVPAPGYVFRMWSGACNGSTSPTCTVVMHANQSASALFAAQLNVSVAPGASGFVLSAPTGIDCWDSGGQCSALYPPGTTVTLSAFPEAGYRFVNWSGSACNGGTAWTCTVPMNGQQSVSATFRRLTCPSGTRDCDGRCLRICP